MQYLTAGESHGDKLVIIIDKVPSGVPFCEDDVNFELKRRSKGVGRSERQNLESNLCKIVSGVHNGRTTANPICVEIPNCSNNPNVNDFIMRPGHADLNGVIKYNFDNCLNVAERASARETAARIVAGVIAKNILAQFGVEVFGYVVSIGSVSLNCETTNMPAYLPNMADIAISQVYCPDEDASQKMVAQINRAAENGDTLGGSARIVAVGLIPGIGGYSQSYDRLDSKIAACVMSVPSVKGVSFGSIDYMAKNVGSATLDCIKKGKTFSFTRTSNFAGGIEGGMTNGMPLIVNAKIKPVPTVKKPIHTVDIENMQETTLQSDKRSDVCVVPNACVVCENEVAFILANAYLEKFGSDCIVDIKQAVDEYKYRIKQID